MDIIQLRKAIGREEFDYPLLASALASYSAVDQKIFDLLRSGAILRVKKGLYVFGADSRQSPICKESLANLIYGPSCVSMEYALAYHGFIPERVETITSVTSGRDKEFKTSIGRFTYRYLGPTKYPHEIDQYWIDKLHPILIATPEKALFDYVVLNDIRSIKSPKTARDFLGIDLSLDSESLPRFNVKKMLRLNSYYKSESMSRIMEAL